MIDWKIDKVPKHEAMDYLKPRLDGFRSHWLRVYIGVTSDPDRRWVKHANRGWSRMIVVYEAFTPEIAADLERDLIDYAHRCGFRVPVENVNPGGEGISAERRSNYLYILVADRR